MRSRLKTDRFASKLSEMLAGLLGVRVADVNQRSDALSGAASVKVAGKTFVMELRKSASAATIAAAAAKVAESAGRIHRNAVPLVVVPFMGGVGRRLCEEAGVGWFDLSGNARIMAPGLRVIVDGQPNRFRSVGRPPNLFAPMSSRIVRWLLTHPAESFSQREIARFTGLDEGFVSRLVSRLERDDYLVRDEGKAVRPKDPGLLLDAWREAYDFSRHTFRRGHVAARSGDALLRFVSERLSEQKIEHAATGLAGAWALTRFATFRIVTVYVTSDPSQALLDRLGFQKEERGSNLWLALPNDEGVFQGAVEKDGIRCVHPVQVYIDLKGQPERSQDAAEHLRVELLNWK
jgi:hypothetical protein